MSANESGGRSGVHVDPVGTTARRLEPRCALHCRVHVSCSEALLDGLPLSPLGIAPGLANSTLPWARGKRRSPRLRLRSDQGFRMEGHPRATAVDDGDNRRCKRRYASRQAEPPSPERIIELMR